MFWRATFLGFEAFTYWQIWVAVILYVSIITIYTIKANLPQHDDMYQPPGLVGQIFGVLLHSFMACAMSYYLTVFIYAIPEALTFSFFTVNIGQILMSTVLVVMIVFVLHIVPLINALVENHSGAALYIAFVIIFYFTTQNIFIHIIGDTPQIASPPFWAILGYFIISLLLFLIGYFVLSVLITLIDLGEIEAVLNVCIYGFFGAWAGVLASFMHAQYVLNILYY